MIRAEWKIFVVVFVVAVTLNFGWEMLQAPLYRMDTAGLPAWLHCFRASLGDGLMVLLILAGGAWIMGSLDWFRRPGRKGYAWMLVSGLVIAVAVEWVAVHILRRWSYTPAMPLLSGLAVGLVPLAQMVVLPPLIFAIAARLTSKQHRRKGGIMKPKLWLIVVAVFLFIAAACARKGQTTVVETGTSEETPAAGAEKTYPLRGKVVSRGPGRNEIKVDHEKVEGLWEPMTMAFEVRGGEQASLPAEGSTIRATLHVRGDSYWLTDVKPE